MDSPRPRADVAAPRPGPQRPRRLRRRSVLAGPGVAAALALLGPTVLSACAEKSSATQPDLQDPTERARPGDPAAAGAVLVPFVSRLLPALGERTGNAVFSPLSAQIALAMVGVGSAGATRAQLEDVFGADVEDAAAATNTLDQVLSRFDAGNARKSADDTPAPPRASLADAAWLQKSRTVKDEFLSELARWFGAGVFTADFSTAEDREQARSRMNAWAEKATRGAIEGLIPQDALDGGTALVLLNTLHLRAAWARPLAPGAPADFTRPDGSTVQVPLLGGTGHRWHEDDLCRASALETHGDQIALVLVRPREDLSSVLDAWAEDPKLLTELLGSMTGGARRTVNISVPAVDIAGTASLRPGLESLGVSELFGADADLSGICSTPLRVDDLRTKTLLRIDQNGIEAAAGSAAVVEPISAPAADPVDLVLDGPFLYLAIETSSGAPLIAGWVSDPTRSREE